VDQSLLESKTSEANRLAKGAVRVLDALASQSTLAVRHH